MPCHSGVGADRRGSAGPCLPEMRADLDAISLHEVPSSRLIEQLILMRSAVRRVSEKIELALQVHRQMNARGIRAEA